MIYSNSSNISFSISLYFKNAKYFFVPYLYTQIIIRVLVLNSDPLEDLFADDIGSDDLHGLDDLVVLEFPGGLGALMLGVLGGLLGDELVAFLADDGFDLKI